MKFLLYIFLSFVITTSGQSLKHPNIWTSQAERLTVLDKINTDINKKWSGKLYDDLHNTIDSLVNNHESDPSSYLLTLPELDKTQNSRSAHSTALYNAVQAGFLFFLDQDEKYAQFAGDILSHYTTRISQESGALWFSKTGRWIECRDLYPKIGMTYDFIAPFILNDTNTIYNQSTGQRELFNSIKAQATFKKLADEVLYKGNVGSNHPVLEAAGGLFNILVLEDDIQRANYFNLFMNGVEGTQDGFHDIMQTFKDNHFLWPESASYGKETHEVCLHLLEVIDRYDPSLNMVNSHRKALKGAFLYEDWKYPNLNAMVRFGDSRRTKHAHFENLYLKVLAISNRAGLNTYKNLAIDYLQGVYNNEQKFIPTIANEALEWDNPTMLFWGIDIDFENNSSKVDYHTSAIYPHAGVGVLRNYVEVDNETYGLMGFIGGGHYVHSHLTGIEMELYGAGMVMGAGSGDPKASSTRGTEGYMNYDRIYAGHNTVVVNGDSKGKHEGMAWKWDNAVYQNTSIISAIEPAANMDHTTSSLAEFPVSNHFSFVTIDLNDGVNDALQQRTFAIVRTSPTTGYYLDIFRSKSKSVNTFHDYIYHNYGESLSLTSDGLNIKNGISSTNQTRYSSDLTIVKAKTTSDTNHISFPGWQYFEKLNTSDQTSKAITGTFNVDKINAKMHFKIPAGNDRDYTACIGPPILETESDYKAEQSDPSKNDSAQVLLIRQYGEAWEKPFIVAFEPSKTNVTIKLIENLTTNNKVVGVKITSVVNGNVITDYLINHDDNSQTYMLESEKIEFTGRFGIIRDYKGIENRDSLIELYIGEGSYLKFGHNELVPHTSETSAYKVINDIPTSRRVFNQSLIDFYPNPANTAITFNTIVKSISIYNSQGEVVLKGKKLRFIGIDALSVGNYIVVINDNIHKKLLVIK